MSKRPFLRSRRLFYAMVAVVVAVAVVLIGWPALQDAQVEIITTPADLNAGEEYRLVFVTASKRTAETRVISTYNDFATAAAESSPRLAALDTSWSVIGSTLEGPNSNLSTINAVTNSSTDWRPTTTNGNGVPIYRLDGARVADDYDDLWNNSIQNPISITDAGTIYSGFVWTGTTGTGTRTVRVLGNGRENHAGPAETSYGDSTRTDLGWINVRAKSADLLSLDNAGKEFPFYAISGVLKVPSPGDR